MVRSGEKDIKIFEININSTVVYKGEIKTIYNAKNIFYDEINKKLYLGTYGSNLENYNLINEYLNSHENSGDYSKIESYGGFEEIDTSGNYKITDLILEKNIFKGVSSGIKIGDKIYLGSWFQKGIFIFNKK